MLIFLPPPSSFLNPTPPHLTCIAFTCLSVCLTLRLNICVCWRLLWFVLFLFPPCFLSLAYHCLDVSLICSPRPCCVLFVLVSPFVPFHLILKPFLSAVNPPFLYFYPLQKMLFMLCCRQMRFICIYSSIQMLMLIMTQTLDTIYTQMQHLHSYSH